MADTRELLTRIAVFRQRLEATSPLMPAAKPAALTPVAPVAEPVALTARAQRLLLTARDLIAKQRQLGSQATLDHDPLAHYHRGTVSLTETALRFAQALPASVEAQLQACDGLEHLVKVIDQRLDSLQQALQLRETDHRRLDRLATLLAGLHAGRAQTLNPFVDLANEILDESRRGARLRWFCPLEAASTDRSALRFVAAHGLNVAAIIARLLPHDYEWATKPMMPVMAALVMDVGLLGVHAKILFLSRSLNDLERRKIEAHPRDGADLIRKLLPESGPLADIVLAHHERLDGSGYPLGLRGESITTLARFLATADTYAALATARPHRAVLDSRSALTEVLMLAEQGKLDRDFAEYLLNLSFHPVGTVVELVDGRLAVVAATHGRADVRASTRPVVAVLTDSDGTVRQRPEFLDLAAADRGGILRSIPKSESRSKLSEWYPELCV
jgi:hypothetical protein